MNAPKNIVPAIALAIAAVTLLPACKAVPQESSTSEPAPAASDASGENGYSWFAKKGRQSRAEKREDDVAAATAEADAALQRVVVTGYCSCQECCGANASGVTASGKKAQLGTIAADTSVFPFGTQLNVPGYGEGVVEDTGSNVKGFHIDLWFPTHAEAKAWGTREMFVAMPPAP